jgi:rhodanese-related sulfurtransferase
MKIFKDTKPRIILAAFIIPLAFVMALVPENTSTPYKISIEQLLEEVNEGAQYIYVEKLADLIIQKDPSIQLIDVRSKEEYETYHLPSAINVPLNNILSPDYTDYLDQDVVNNIFYSNGTVHANQAWMICTQRGFKNNYVLQGGLNHWADAVLNPQKPAQTAPSDEFAKYDFAKAAKAALGGGSIESLQQDATAAPMPKITKKKKKKKVKGGCS